MSTKHDPFPSQSASLNINVPLQATEERARNRQWERAHQDQKATYRGVDPKLAMKVKAIAGDLRVPEGEAARAVIEYALRAYERGELDLCARPDPDRMRMTLIPTSDVDRFSAQSRKTSRHKHARGGWRVIITWRGFPPELKGELSVLASDAGLNVPIGELITALLRYGLRAYEYGLLKLEAIPAAESFTLVWKGQK